MVIEIIQIELWPNVKYSCLFDEFIVTAVFDMILLTRREVSVM
jgi:hypothetical protein